jgi:hypothetical protein
VELHFDVILDEERQPQAYRFVCRRSSVFRQ